MDSSTRQYLLAATVLVAAGVMLFIGMADFNTKGEPREAVVAYSMLESGNWILPQNNGGDMAYKPPFFHWLIAAAASVAGGVNEYVSRFPSALALVVMSIGTFIFYARRRGKELALWTTLIAATSFEVHRAATNCRVDMVLTACIVLALYLLFCWAERGLRGIPLAAILCMSAAVLTKGPVGILLPCMVVAVFSWMRGGGFLRTTGRVALAAALSCVLPALWYYAAYRQGGDAFLQLVYEENVLRFLGKMSYGSHENPAYYNVLTLLAGYMPYTLLVVLSLFFQKPSPSGWKPKQSLERLKNGLRNMDAARLYSLLSIALIFCFYCIPKSKRSVYLLPVYPFIAYFLAEYLIHLARFRPVALRVYGSVLAGASVLLLAAFGAVRMGWVAPGIFHGKHAAENALFLEELHTGALPLAGCAALILLMLAVVFFCKHARRDLALPGSIFLLTFTLYLAFDGLFGPMVLNRKSDRRVAEQVALVSAGVPVYSYVKTEMLHFFTINFYRHNTIVPFEQARPSSGYLLVGEKDFGSFRQSHPGYTFRLAFNSGHRSCDTRQNVQLYAFQKNDEPQPNNSPQ